MGIGQGCSTRQDHWWQLWAAGETARPLKTDSAACWQSPSIIVVAKVGGNSRLDEEVGGEARVGEGEACDRGGRVVSKPLLHGLPLIRLPICCYHCIPQQNLQMPTSMMQKMIDCCCKYQ